MISRKARPAIAVFCSYTPRELVEAAGFNARLLSGFESDSPDLSLPDNLCSYVRRCASYLLNGGDPSLEGVVLTDSCYPMLRLWDCLEEQGSPPFRWLLKVPRKDTPEAIAFFRRELEGLAAALAERSGAGVDDACLAAAIESSNETLALQVRMREKMLSGSAPGLASKFLADLSGAGASAYGGAGEGLADILSEADNGSTSPVERPRLLLAGSFFINPALATLLEERGAVVAAVDSCFSGRHGAGLIQQEGGDPMERLAESYLCQPPCPRMAKGADHIRSIGSLAAADRFDGVVLLLPRNCTPQAYHAPLWREEMERAGTPLLVLEVEDCDWSMPRSLTRLEAFLETLKA